MSELNTNIPDKPEGWQPDRSMHMNMTDINGTHWTQKDDRGRLWKMFVDRFHSQPTRDISGQHGEIGRRLEERGEVELKEKEDRV